MFQQEGLTGCVMGYLSDVPAGRIDRMATVMGYLSDVQAGRNVGMTTVMEKEGWPLVIRYYQYSMATGYQALASIQN